MGKGGEGGRRKHRHTHTHTPLHPHTPGSRAAEPPCAREPGKGQEEATGPQIRSDPLGSLSGNIDSLDTTLPARLNGRKQMQNLSFRPRDGLLHPPCTRAAVVIGSPFTPVMTSD